jgi:hypothetical protein
MGEAPAAIRLRALADNLFLPVDAVLEPTLLDDEAAALVRDRGLVFLPGGSVLAFPTRQPLTAAELLVCPRQPARGWQPLPTAPLLPDRLQQIVLDEPDETPDVILQSGGGDIGTEEPRPSIGSTMGSIAAGAVAGAAYSLVWLGQKLGLGSLARLGAALFNRAMRGSPRLSESVLGRQEAALRELLRQFREGRLEDALRRALPLNAPADRGSQIAPNAQLPTHNTRYNLRDLLFGSGRPASLWLGGRDVQMELAAEYRKAAEAAAARGDWRRAAFIWGKLLHDHRQAAAVLARGGLHHDAAVIYLELLDAALAAAREFEAAGEIDRALALYRQRGGHVAAGDLLRRAGEEELALCEYRIAAEQRAAAGDHVAAGDLLRDRGKRPDLALPYYEAGWALRPGGSAFACLERLLPLRAGEPSSGGLLQLLDETDAFFGPEGANASAGQFYNALVRLADGEHLATLRADLRDRALLGLAHKLLQQSETGPRNADAPAALFGRNDAWHASLVRDASFAAKAARARPQSPSSPQLRRVEVRRGTVTAVCSAAETGALFLGYADGDWAIFEPGRESVLCCESAVPVRVPIQAMASNQMGDVLVALHAPAEHSQSIVVYRVDTSGVRCLSFASLIHHAESMTLVAEAGGPPILGLWAGASLCVYRLPDLVATGPVPLPKSMSGLRQALLLQPSENGRPRACLCFDDHHQLWYSRGDRMLQPLTLHVPLCSTITGVEAPLAHRWHTEDQIELAGIDFGGIGWTSVRFGEQTTSIARAGSAKKDYLAITLLPNSRIAAVAPHGIDWLRREGRSLVPTAGPRAPLGDAVACTCSPLTREVLIVLRSGAVVRVPVPT